MKKIILFLIIAALVVFFVTRDNAQNVENEVVSDEMSQQETISLEDESIQVEALDNAGDVLGLSNGYQAYGQDKLAFANDGNVVIFFRASWCPSCKALDESIKANINTIPENLLILDADYDVETEMKQKYGVTTQHSLVQVDAEGNMIQKWAGGSTLDSIVEKL